MKIFAAVLLLALSATLVGCSSSQIAFMDISPTPTATISRDTVTVHIGSDMRDSACFVRPKAKIEGQTICLVGHRTLREQSREFAVKLPASMSPKSVTVVWRNPDESRVSIPITR